MNSSEYVASFFLIVIGFAVSEVLKGSARLIRERRLIRFYWPYVLVIPFLLEGTIFIFLWLFNEIKARGSTEWSILELITISLVVIPYALISYLLFPSRIKEGFDMKAFLIDNGRMMIVVLIAQFTLVLLLMILRGDFMFIPFQALNLALTALVYYKFEKFHVIWLIAVTILMNVFIFIDGPISIR